MLWGQTEHFAGVACGLESARMLAKTNLLTGVSVSPEEVPYTLLCVVRRGRVWFFVFGSCKEKFLFSVFERMS